MIEEGVEHLEARLLVNCPPENVTAEDEWRDLKAGLSK